MPLNNPQYPETLQHMLDVFTRLFSDKGIKTPDQLALEAVILISDTFGGLQTYIPKSEGVRRHLRNIEIYRKSGKQKARELALEYGLTEAQIYSIIKRGYNNSRQAGLP